MLNFIPAWDSLKENHWLKNDIPNEYVVFATGGYIVSPFKSGSFTAIATIGQRDEDGRLFQHKLHSRHFVPRKFTVTVKDARLQIRVLHSLVAGLNNGTIAPGNIPRTVSSVRAWDAICGLLKVSVGASDA